MHEVKAIVRTERREEVLRALHAIASVPGVTLSVVQSVGRLRSVPPAPDTFGETTMLKLELVVTDELLNPVLEAIRRAAATGRPGDGRIFVSAVEESVQVHQPA